MDEFLKESWIRIARELDAVVAREREMSFEQLSEALNAVGHRFKEYFTRHQQDDDVIHVRRAIADRILTVAVDKKRPIKECEEYLAALGEIGFVDFHKECTCRLMFSRYLIECRATEKAMSELEGIEKSHQRVGSPYRWVVDRIKELRQLGSS